MFTETLSFAFDDASAVLLLKGISQIAERADLTLSLLPFPPPTPGENLDARRQRDSRVVRNSLVDRFLAYSMPDDHPAAVTAIARRLPTVIVDSPFHEDVHYVGIRDRAAAREAAEHLIALGHRRFGIIVDRLVPDGKSGFVSPARLRSTQEAVPRERLRGYRDAFTSAGISWASVAVLEAGGLTVPLFDVAAETMLDTRDVTAVLAVNDELGMAVIRACRRRNIAVPERLSVVGFDDVPAAELAGLTTVHQSFIDKGRAAAELLTEGATAVPQRILLPTTFVERASTAAPTTPS
jgi:DNA-binding LacI/PurR family transcriptional regulator